MPVLYWGGHDVCGSVSMCVCVCVLAGCGDGWVGGLCLRENEAQGCLCGIWQLLILAGKVPRVHL